MRFKGLKVKLTDYGEINDLIRKHGKALDNWQEPEVSRIKTEMVAFLTPEAFKLGR